MSPKKLVGGDEVLARQVKDPAFRAEREVNSLARAVAIEVVKYRAEHGLSQSAFAKQLGVSQPVVARLERGDHAPTWDTLGRLARTMEVEFLVEVHPTAGPDSVRSVDSRHAAGCDHSVTTEAVRSRQYRR